MTSAIDVLIDEITKKKEEIDAYVMTGRCADYAEYRFYTGQTYQLNAMLTRAKKLALKEMGIDDDDEDIEQGSPKG